MPEEGKEKKRIKTYFGGRINHSDHWDMNDDGKEGCQDLLDFF